MTAEPDDTSCGKVLAVRAIGAHDQQEPGHFTHLAERMLSACVVAVYGSIEKAEEAMRMLHLADFPRSQVSLVISRLKSDPELLAELKMGDDSLRDGAVCAGLGGVLGYFGGIAVSLVAGVGTVFLAGPIGGLFAGAAVGSFLGAMAGIGVRDEHIGHYEKCVKDGKVLLIAHGNPPELNKAHRVLEESDAAEVHLHRGDAKPPLA